MPILVFVCTADHFGLFICMSVARNLPKSVLLYVYKTKKVQVGKDQEKAQSEKDSHSKIYIFIQL